MSAIVKVAEEIVVHKDSLEESVTDTVTVLLVMGGNVACSMCFYRAQRGGAEGTAVRRMRAGLLPGMDPLEEQV